MAKNRTNKSRYPSRYSPNGWVSAPQYITELVCEKKAQKEKKELPMKFWERTCHCSIKRQPLLVYVFFTFTILKKDN
jgi:chorismate-pyruvate lyase